MKGCNTNRIQRGSRPGIEHCGLSMSLLRSGIGASQSYTFVVHRALSFGNVFDPLDSGI
jgi:hypothetical protein